MGVLAYVVASVIALAAIIALVAGIVSTGGWFLVLVGVGLAGGSIWLFIQLARDRAAVAARREFWWGLGAFSGFLLLYLGLAAAGWPGAADKCVAEDTCFCEIPHAADLIQQPANTWSNLGFVGVALFILWWLGRDRDTPPTPSNPLTTPSAYAVLYGAVALFLGPGSMLFHGSLRDWGGWLDILSLILFGSFGLLYAVSRIFRGLMGWSFVGGYALLTIGIGLAAWFTRHDADVGPFSVGSWFFAGLVVLWVLTEGVIVFGHPRGLWRSKLLLGWAFLTFLGGLAIQIFSQTGMPLCTLTGRDSLFQGHGLWQLLAAAAVLLIFFYLCSERTDPT